MTPRGVCRQPDTYEHTFVVWDSWLMLCGSTILRHWRMDWKKPSLSAHSYRSIIPVNRKKNTCFILHNWREIFQYVSKYKNNPSETRESGTLTEGKNKVTSSACCSLSHTNKWTCIRRRCTTSITRYIIVINMTTTRCLMAIVFYLPITKPHAKQMWYITDEMSIMFT
jgi:hypothetical protein